MVPLLVATALAGIVPQPPEGARTVTLLLCPDAATCSDETFWLTHQPDLATAPIVVVDNLLAMNAALQENNTARGITFRDALAAARRAVAARDWSAASFALDDTERALDAWLGTPTNQELFDVHYLRAVVALGRRVDPADSLAASVAVAWNRTVALPDPSAETAWYTTLRALLADGTGHVHLDAGPPGTDYWLDGVALGAGPLDVEVFPGVHRVNALHGPTQQEWRGAVTVQAGRTSRARARLSLAEDEAWVTAALVRALEERRMDPEVGELLRGWAEHFGLQTVRLVRAFPVEDPDPLAAFTLHAVSYDPQVRRFVQ